MATSARTLRPHGVPDGAELRRDVDARRRERSPWRALYKTARWLALRSQQLQAEPLCRMCLDHEPRRLTPATVCDHVERHGGDVDRFFAGPFQSLCKTCHDGAKQAMENATSRRA